MDFPPDLDATFGQAWRLHLDHARQPSLVSWLILRPGAHPLWAYYLLHLIHLRPLEGFPPAEIRLPGATHQIFIFAVDPAWEFRGLDQLPALLYPINFSAQMCWDSDEEAEKRIELTVEEICQGILSPDTDAGAEWIRRFNDSLLSR